MLSVRFDPEARQRIAVPTLAKVFAWTSAEEFRSSTPSSPPVNVLFVRRMEDAFSTFTPTSLSVKTFPSNSIGGYSVVGSWKYATLLSWNEFQLKQFRRRVLYDFAPYTSLYEISLNRIASSNDTFVTMPMWPCVMRLNATHAFRVCSLKSPVE